MRSTTVDDRLLISKKDTSRQHHASWPTYPWKLAGLSCLMRQNGKSRAIPKPPACSNVRIANPGSTLSQKRCKYDVKTARRRRFQIGITTVLLVAGATLLAGSCRDEGPSPPKSPEEELTTYEIEQGRIVELVADGVLVKVSVAISFDVDGSLWVVDMRGFMPDMEGAGEGEPV